QVITRWYRPDGVRAPREAAVGGTASAVVPSYMASQRGGLERLVPERGDVERFYWISVHSDQADSPRIRALMQELERQVHRDRGVFPPSTAPAQRALEAVTEG